MSSIEIVILAMLPEKVINLCIIVGGIHGWGTTIGTEDLKTFYPFLP